MRPSRDHSPRDRGDTLVEVLLALMILGLASVALIVAFQTSITASSQHRNISAITSAMSDVTSAAYSEVRTAGTSIFDAQQPVSAYKTIFDPSFAAALPSYMAATVYSVSFWEPSQQTFGATFTKYQPQLMTVAITSTKSTTTTYHSVVITDPSPPPSPTYGTTPTQLAFAVEPAGATVNTPFTTQPVIVVEDAAGNVVPSGLPYFTISIVPSTNPSGAVLSSSCAPAINGGGSFQFQNCSINQLGSGFQLQVTSPGLASATSTTFAVSSVPLAVPTVTNVTPSTSTAGAIVVNYTGSSNAPAGQNYILSVCSDAAMTQNCTSIQNFTSGSTVSGLTQGVTYYAQLEAAPSTGYLAATSPPVGPTLATSQLTAPTTVTLDYGATAGSIRVTFTGSSNAQSGQTYSARACTNSGMTQNCVSNPSIASGGQITGLSYSPGVAGTGYYVTVTANASAGFLASSPSAVSGAHADTSVLNAPTNLTVASSSTTVGAITASFNASSGVAPTSYSATACTDLAMTNCVTQAPYTSGSQFTGLTAGSGYYVMITTVAPTGFVNASTTSSSATLATSQLVAPTNVTLSYGATAGSIKVTFTGSANAPVAQTYSALACTDSNMSQNCVSAPSVTSGGQITGLSYTAGVVGTNYYVTVTANASAGYLASSPSAAGGPQPETSALNAPTNLTVASSSTTVGAITASFNASSGVAPTSYSATACTDLAMTNCVTQAPYTSGSQFTGLTAGSGYYVMITAVPPIGFVSANVQSGSTVLATSQLTAPTNVTLGYGTTAGSLSVSFTGSSNAPIGQTYTALACTDPYMSAGCKSNTSLVSGGQITGLSYSPGVAGTSYYVTVTANASAGFLVSAPTSYVGPQPATSMLEAPTNVTGTDNSGWVRINGNWTYQNAMIVSFVAPSGVAPTSYSATVCTNASMSTNCVTSSPITSGGQITGLIYGASYYVVVSANPPPGFLGSSAMATSTVRVN